MNNPLVTVCVISYNSGETIIETLESVKNQTYSNIELIISDDHSSDNTIPICEKWLAENKDRFTSMQLLTVERNTGTTANVNRAYKASSGEWLKGIAADDILLPNCLEDNVKYVGMHPEIEWLASKMKHYYGTFDEKNLVPYEGYYQDKLFCYNLDAEGQFMEELKSNFIGSPSVFLKKELIEAMGYYNEKYVLLEDIPMNLKLMKTGHKCYFMDVFTVGYRKRDNTSKKLFSVQLANDDKAMTEDMKFEFFTDIQKKNYLKHYKLKRLFEKWGLNNRHSLVCRVLFTQANNIIDIIYK